MPRIKIENLSKDRKMPVEEMKKIRGGIIVVGPGNRNSQNNSFAYRLAKSGMFDNPGIIIETYPTPY